MPVPVPVATPADSDADDSASVAEAAPTDEVTEPEAAPVVRAVPDTGRVELSRIRKATLVSPIPAMLAASMGKVEERLSEGGIPMPLDGRVDVTSRLDDAQRESLLQSDEDDYVVEVIPEE